MAASIRFETNEKIRLDGNNGSHVLERCDGGRPGFHHVHCWATAKQQVAIQKGRSSNGVLSQSCSNKSGRPVRRAIQELLLCGDSEHTKGGGQVDDEFVRMV